MRPHPLLAIALLFSPLAFAAAPNSDATVTLLQKLADAPGAPGYEEAVRRIVVDEVKPIAAKIQYDGMGSVIAQHGDAGPRIMLDAHMDELGGLIRRVTPGGVLTMQMLGGWMDAALFGQRWVIIGSKGPVEAVTAMRDVHVVTSDERTRVPSRNQLFLDVGARNAAEVAAMGLSVGDPVVPDAPFAILNGTNNYLGKAWDDRAGCAVLILALQKLAAQGHPNQLFTAFTVQEEIGLRGADTAVALVKPDIGIAIEGGVTGDVLGNPEETQVRLGAGPAMFYYDASALPNRKFTFFTKEVAADQKIPLQFDLVQGYGEDMAEIQRSNGGVPTVNLVVPIRYTHVHNGIMNRQDFDQLVDLVVAMIQKLDAPTVARIRDFAPAP